MRQFSCTSIARFLVGCLLLLAAMPTTAPLSVRELSDAVQHHSPAGQHWRSTEAEAAIPRTTIASETAAPPARITRGPTPRSDENIRVVALATAQTAEHHQQRVLRI